MKPKRILFFMTFILWSFGSFGYFEASEPTSPSEMNGIKFGDYKDFADKWHLVTVRYREDSNEMRVVYANDLAWKEMKNLKPNYSDGAVFAKVGMIAERDPAFTSSLVPSGAKRYQLMVRDRKKYKSTQGWGYALFDADGRLFKDAAKSDVKACAACHSIVPERDYVFSRAMATSFGSSAGQIERPEFLKDALQFESKSIEKFPSTFRALLAPSVKAVFSLEGKLKSNAFSGTLDEIVPVLIENSKNQGRSSTLYIDDHNFTLVSPAEQDSKCQDKKTSYKVQIVSNGGKVRDSVVCQ